MKIIKLCSLRLNHLNFNLYLIYTKIHQKFLNRNFKKYIDKQLYVEYNLICKKKQTQDIVERENL